MGPRGRPRPQTVTATGAIVALCLLAAAAIAPVGILPGGAIAIDARADHLVLGPDSQTELSIRVVDSSGAPADQMPPTLLASVGVIGEVQRSAPGQFTATYRAPATGSPRVAIVLCRVRGRSGLIVGWTRIPLWGQGRVSIVTKPASQVVLRIGEAAFGPVESDETGRAELEILVPPGPTHGVAETVDRAGNQSKKTIDLGVQPFSRVAAFALDQTVVADGTPQSGLAAFAVDRRGVALGDAPLIARAGRGRTGAVDQLAPGVYRIEYRAPTQVGDGSDRVVVELADDKASRIEVEIALTAGDPSAIAAEIVPASYRAGSGVRPRLVLRATDSAGNPSPPSLVDVEVEGGVLGVPTQAPDGGVAYPIEVDDHFGDRRELVAQARAIRGGAVGRATLALQSAPCARLSLDGPSRVVGDGRVAEYTVGCSDRFGNRAPLPVPLVSADQLELISVERVTTEEVMVRARAPVLQRARQARLLVESGDLSAVARIEVSARIGVEAAIGPRLVAGWNYGAIWRTGAVLDWQLAFPLAADAVTVGLSMGTLLSPPLIVAAEVQPRLRRISVFPCLVQVGYRRPLFWRLVGRAALGAGPLVGAPVVDQNGRAVDTALVVAPAVEALAALGITLGTGVLEGTMSASYGQSLTARPEVGQLGGLAVGLGYRVGF
ncbi:MAG: hypothetical protein JXR83_21420 [Deltaproteobacteria bacterium]|nr:hypothetical protein [Deltaproteobacteria bacterium]